MKWLKRLAPVLLVVVVAGVFLLVNTIDARKSQSNISYNDLVLMINDAETAEATINVRETYLEIVIKTTADDTSKIYSMPIQEGAALDTISTLLAQKGGDLTKVDFTDLRSTGIGYMVQKYSQFIFWGMLILLFLYMVKRNAGGGATLFSFMKSKAKLYDPEKGKLTFKDVAGLEDAKIEAQELIDSLKEPERFKDMGGRMPNGALFIGPPGTGKTLLAKAIAGEAGVSFIHGSASENVELFVGAGASKIRDLFGRARKIVEKGGKVILFIDELDAVGKARSNVKIGGHDEYEQTLGQLLTEMDGFENNESIIVIGATNRDDVLDPALVRPGRFDRKVYFELPLKKDRLAILELYAQKIKRGDDLDLKTIAEKTFQHSGAELENIVNDATLLAIREKANSVQQKHFDEAIDKVHLGARRKSITVSHKQRDRIATHEAGHALVGYHFEGRGGKRVEIVSIVPRRTAGGYVRTIAEEDIQLFSREQIEADIAMGLGSYVAEHKVYGDNCRGVSADLEQVTGLAYNMVTKWGMSKAIGPRCITAPHQAQYGMPEGQQANSEALLQKIDLEIDAILQDLRTQAEKIISDNEDTLLDLKETLLREEQIDRGTFLTIIEKNKRRQKGAE